MDHQQLIDQIRSAPGDLELRLVYEDWLEEHGDPRAELSKVLRAMEGLFPDHSAWRSLEERISRLREGVEPEWLALFEPATIGGDGYGCVCLSDSERLDFHRDLQDRTCSAWLRILELVEEAAATRAYRFEPSRDMEPAEWKKLKTLPASIGKLTETRELHLYGSSLVRLPPEIGEMRSLKYFDPYTSRRLHWLPYEITRCTELADSRVSTRALYGNYKTRIAFPKLTPPTLGPLTPPSLRRCSVCSSEFEDRGLHRVWISLRVATDVLPLLVNACSNTCIERLPPGAPRHLERWHRGGDDAPSLQPA